MYQPYPHPPSLYRRIARSLFGATLGLLLMHTASADDDRRDGRTPLLPLYQQECGACHAPFRPGLLPAASWQRLMGDLPHHFGTDASLDAATATPITAWLTMNGASSRRWRESPPQDRITRSTWFARKHHEVSAATWKLPSIKSPANCSACHAKADQGDFNEHDVRIPR